MNGLTGLVDSLLSAKLAPRLDVLAIKGEVEIDAPGPVVQVQKVDNDVRLLSNAALDRLIPVGPSSVPRPMSGQAPETHLSVAARVISAVLANLLDEAGPVKGAAPAWPSTQAPSGAALAGTLAQTVSDSGLFYESHLAQFASGTRTLEQLAREPQARWATAAVGQQRAAAQAFAGTLPVVLGAMKDAPAATAAQAAAVATAAQVGSQVASQIAAQAAGEPLPSPVDAKAAAPVAHGDKAQESDVVAPGSPRTPSSIEAAVPVDAARVQAAYSRGGAAPSIAAHEAASAERQAEEGGVRHLRGAAASAASSPAAQGEVIHPQTVTLVHQQLDLLATAVFRWSGQAWPGVPMDWTIHEEVADRQAESADEEIPRRWSTTVSLILPRLGTVDLRVGLVDSSVQARIVASEEATTARLRSDGPKLRQRFEAAGLRLDELQITGAQRP